MSLCSNCGSTIPENNAFCGKCGNPVTTEPTLLQATTPSSSEMSAPSVLTEQLSSGFSRKVAIGVIFAVLLFVAMILLTAKKSGQSTAATTPASVPISAPVSSADANPTWDKNESVNSIDGVKTTVYRDSNGRSTIIVRLKGKALEAYVITPEMVGYDDTSVRIRFDDERPVRQSWSRSSDYHALFASNPRQFVAKLQASKKLYLEYHPYQKVAETISFDVSGLTLPQSFFESYDKRHKQEQAAWQKKFDACVKDDQIFDTDRQKRDYCKVMTQ
ncbi:zinc-ribbon domain-containing protein [Granulicella rosea]|uniref:Zinc-ribbon domain-containing protein n=1 Tax=Granulicella rosea TaxID=474952 RepID=A0A239DPM2_9BACT|nr:zinc ribbon domain-containing protein [Granulicella rosea]SNS33848.1 zinc-ribbon domain-containing protein [Granulicella rosea]